MHRMMFEDIKLLSPDLQIHFACPLRYHQAVIDHPFIDMVIDSSNVDTKRYVIHFNTTTACGNYEMSIAPRADLHRSDIWAKHCGLKLLRHNMHIQFLPGEIETGRAIIENHRTRPGPIVLIVPHSAIGSKDLEDHQIQGVAQGLSQNGYCPIGLHTQPIRALVKNGFSSISQIGIRQWMSVIQQADYLITVDTAALHCAGGLGKPTVGVFTWADGYVYCQHYPSVTVVQRHRTTHPDWTCGPCYAWFKCQKSTKSRKPCVTELTVNEVMEGFQKMVEKTSKDVK